MSYIALVSLKSKTASYFTSQKKMGLFRNSGELEIGTSNLRQNPRQVQQTKERNVILWRRRKSEGVVLNKSPLEKSKSSG